MICFKYLHFFIIGYSVISCHQTSGVYHRRCYNVNNYQHCLSTDLTEKTWLEAKAACVANNSVLISVTSSDIQSVLEQFLSYVNSSSNLSNIDNGAVWIDVSTDEIDSFHWMTGSRETPTVELDQNVTVYNRFAIIAKHSSNILYLAQSWNSLLYYICQYAGGTQCDSNGHFRNSTCYKKYSETVTWFTASNRCLSMNSSLATFNDLRTPSDDKNLTSWLSVSGTTKYWVGLVRRWFVTTGQDGSVDDVQYTKWESGNPSQPPDDNNKTCVALQSQDSTWIDSISCAKQQRFICQAKFQLSSSSTTTASSSTTTTTTAATTTRSTTNTKTTKTLSPSTTRRTTATTRTRTTTTTTRATTRATTRNPASTAKITTKPTMSVSAQTKSSARPAVSSQTSSPTTGVTIDPDGFTREQSPTRVLIPVTNSELTTSTSIRRHKGSSVAAAADRDAVALGVGIGVGLGVPIIVAIVVVLVIVLTRRRQNNSVYSTQHKVEHLYVTYDKKQQEDVVNKYGGGMEMKSAKSPLSTQHLIDNNICIYANVVPIQNHDIYANIPPTTADIKQQLTDVIYADLQTVASQN